MRSIENLINTLPSHASIINNQRSLVEISYKAVQPSGQLTNPIQLVIRQERLNCITISEAPKHHTLPRACVERHINKNSTFCLHLDSQNPVQEHFEAINWWAGLNAFINHQNYAEKHHKWPMNAQLSHGDAANVQIAMETAGEPLGWKDEITQAIFRDQGWLSGQLTRASKDHTTLVNAKTPCPRGCTLKHPPLSKQSCMRSECKPDCTKRHNQILRANCPNKDAIEKIVLLEHIRRELETAYLDKLVKDGVTCCGTMDNCPLK